LPAHLVEDSAHLDFRVSFGVSPVVDRYELCRR
jgi:hypothetical protein